MAYTNSPLVTYTNLTKNCSKPRKAKIDTITIHCFVGQVTAKQGCDYFATTDRQVSSNYVVGKDGSIGLSVEEKDRSWCSSNGDNDNRAITIEVASNTTEPYAVTNQAYAALVDLVTDICKRNGIKQLLWKADKSLVGQIDRQNMTVHRWFAAKACPGDYLYNLHDEIAAEVNQRLGVSTPTKPTLSKTDATLEPGARLTLKSVPLYVSSTARDKSATRSGEFYLWSNEVVNGRVKITNRKTSAGVAGQVTGWIKQEDAEKSLADAPASYIVRVTVSSLNIRSAPGMDAPVTGCITDRGAYTIVDEAAGVGASRWGKLKSGAGWISLDYVEKV